MTEQNAAGDSARQKLIDDPRAIRHRLKSLSKDLWWSWNEIGRRPFAMLDPELWEAVRYIPFRILKKVDPNVYNSRLSEPSFREVSARAITAHQDYHNRRTWYEANTEPPIHCESPTSAPSTPSTKVSHSMPVDLACLREIT